jgi:dolichol-phosphate mannosyltransferase
LYQQDVATLTIRPSISAFVPAYNEEANIADVVREADVVLGRVAHWHEIIVVDDGSSDGTGRILDELEGVVDSLVVIHHSRNLGIGSAMMSGYCRARGELVFFNSADGQTPMSHLEVMLPHLEHCDLIVGYHPQRHDPWHRKVLSWGYHQLVRRLLGIHLRNVNALKLFRREVFDPGHPYTDSFCFDTELVAIAVRRAFRVCEIPLSHFPRSSGRSHVASVGRVVHTFIHLISLWRSLQRSDDGLRN